MDVAEGNGGAESVVYEEPPSSVPLNQEDGKEETFEDAPEELDVYEGRRIVDDSTEAVVASNETMKVFGNEGVVDGELERLRDELEKAVGEKEFIAKQYKDEREAFGRELGYLRRQLKAAAEHQPLPSESNSESVDHFYESESVDGEGKWASQTSLHEFRDEFLQFLKGGWEERVQTESTIRELNEVLFVKDQEIGHLNARVMELSAAQDASSEVQHEIDAAADRMLASLAMVVNQELWDSSGCGKMVYVEKGTTILFQKYNQILYEVDLLRQYLPDPNYNLILQDEFGVVFKAVRNELQQLRIKEANFVDRLTYLENENNKVLEQLGEYKAIVEKTDAELGKTKMELQQEKTRLANTKEKLGLAVTKGKALVQQRDSLKHSLTDKTSEFEKCLAEIQVKSSALEAAELRIEELVKNEDLVVSLQETLSQRDDVLEKIEEVLFQVKVPGELQSDDTVTKYRWVVDELNGIRGELLNKESSVSSLQEMIQQKDVVLENFEVILSQVASEELLEKDTFERLRWIVEDWNAIKGELMKSEMSAASLQEMLLQRNALLQSIEDILSQTSESEEAKETTLTERIRWLVDENNVLKNESLEFHRLKHDLLSINLQEPVSPSDLESRVGWLKESFYNSKDEISTLQDEIARTREAARNEIDRLSVSLSAELQEKDCLKTELDNLTSKYMEIVEKEHRASQEKEHLVKVLQDVSGVTMQDTEGVYQPSTDNAMLVDRCFEKLKEQNTSGFNSPCVDVELFERIQGLLYVRATELMLCEELLEEDTHVRSEVNILSNELRLASQEVLAVKEENALARSEVDNLSNELSVASRELLVLKEENVSLQKGLERSEEKAVVLREKLSLAVKKGKGLVQDRENLRRQLDEKNSEIEKLRLELQQKESAIADCMGEISGLSTNLECIPKLEADLAALKDQKDQLEQFLLESNNMLHRVVESIDSIILPIDYVFEEPVEKVKWLATYLNECHDSKSVAEQELVKAKEEADVLASKMAESQINLRTLEDALSAAENNISLLAEKKKETEIAKENLEKELEEAFSQTSKLAEVNANRNMLEDALSELKTNISLLTNEKEEAQVSRAAAETELEKVKEEMTIQTSKLAEAYKVIKSLEDALSRAENNLSKLAEEKREIEVAKENVEEELKEAHFQTSELAEVYASRNFLEDALSELKRSISVLENEKEEAQGSRAAAETALEKMKEESTIQTSKLAEAYRVIKALEDAQSEAENNLTQLAQEKREIELAKTKVEEELKETCSQTREFAEVHASRSSLEDTLAELKRNISVLNNEKEEFQASRVAIETELEKAKEELTVQTSKVADAHRIIKSLGDALSEAESDTALLTEQNNNVQAHRTSLENELQKLHEEAESHGNKMENALRTIKSLEDALLKAESNISVLESERKTAEQEISTLSAKLSACMDELAGTSGNLKSRSLELIGYLNDLQVLVKDESLLSIMKECFGKKLESLKDMDHILNNIWDQFGNLGSEMLQSHPAIEEDSRMINLLSNGLHNILSVEMGNDDDDPVNDDDISRSLKKTVKGFQLRNKIITNKLEDFSTVIDELDAAMLRKMQTSRDELAVMFEHQDSLKQNLSLEIYKQEQENTITSLENDVGVLLSACCDATRELQFEVTNNLLESCSVPELEQLKHSVPEELIEVNGEDSGDKPEHEQTPHSSKYKREADLLLLASRKAYSQTRQFESMCKVAAAAMEGLQNRLEETGKKLSKAMEERDLKQHMVSKMESDIDGLQSSCSELRHKLQQYQSIENKLEEREAELSSLYQSSQTQKQEMEDALPSVSEVKLLLEKISEIDVPFSESEIGGTELGSSVHLKKLIYIINIAAELQHQINLLSHDKKELESTLAKQNLEIQHLEDEVATNEQDSQNMKSELSELTLGLEKIIDMLGVTDFKGDQKSAGVKRSLAVLEKQLTTLHWESENSRAKSQELGTKLVESQKVVEELSNRVQLLEDALKGKTGQPEIVQERSTFEAPSQPTGSDKSEIEDAGPVMKKSTSAASTASTSAPHVRTLKKGSNDHLALTIDPESAPLINEETNEDKGHVFKSLNTSGLIPTQGKLFADRVDGIWVSGGRVLMSRPRARLGLIAYCILVHIWLLGVIL